MLNGIEAAGNSSCMHFVHLDIFAMVCISNRNLCGVDLCSFLCELFNFVEKKTTRIQQHDLKERRDHNMCAQLAWKNSLNAQFHFFSFHSLKWTKPTKKKRKKWKEIKQKSEKEKQQLHCTGKWSSCCYVHNVRSFGTECIRNWWVWMNERNERASKRVKEGVSEWSVWKCSTCAYLQLNEINLMREREVKKELVLSICSTFNLMW